MRSDLIGRTTRLVPEHLALNVPQVEAGDGSGFDTPDSPGSRRPAASAEGRGAGNPYCRRRRAEPSWTLVQGRLRRGRKRALRGRSTAAEGIVSMAASGFDTPDSPGSRRPAASAEGRGAGNPYC